MTRYVVAFEGKETEDHRIIDLGALIPRSNVLGVTDTSVPPNIVGTAVDFERNEATGELSFDIRTKNNDDLSDYSPVIYVAHADFEVIDGKTYIRKGIIQDITFVPGPGAWGNSLISRNLQGS
jgi:hypothetical protein